MNAKLQKSKDFTEEYCCSVVKVGELTPVENSDRLMQTRINGESIVVNKQDVKEGDVMLYVSNECQISGWFLGANNMYRHHTLNHNASVVVSTPTLCRSHPETINRLAGMQCPARGLQKKETTF